MGATVAGRRAAEGSGTHDRTGSAAIARSEVLEAPTRTVGKSDGGVPSAMRGEGVAG